MLKSMNGCTSGFPRLSAFPAVTENFLGTEPRYGLKKPSYYLKLFLLYTKFLC